MVQAEIWQIAQTVMGPAVLLRPEGTDRVIPIYVGMFEAQAILIGLADKELARPMTHDLMKRIFDELHVRVSHIAVTNIRDNTFYAELHGNHGDHEFSIDSRPSDCMALAVRLKCPIYVDETVIESASVAIATLNITPSDGEEEHEPVLDLLKKKLQAAVDQEDYETAATLRDRIRKLEGDS